MSRTIGVGAVVASLLAGCSISASDLAQSEPSYNKCKSSSECGKGRCDAGACVANSTAFTTVLFEVHPSSSTSDIAGARFLERVSDLPTGGGRVDLRFGHIARVTGIAVPSQPGFQTNCSYGFIDPTGTGAPQGAGSDGSIPAHITLTPHEGVLGLPTVDYTFDATQPSTTSPSGGSYTFSLNIPPGDYSVYVQPLPATQDSCSVPPQLYRMLNIAAGDVTLDLKLPTPQHLALTVRWPDNSTTLDGWTVDMVDPISGKLLSTQATLGNGQIVSGVLQYVTGIDYSPAVDATASTGKELVRLSPPDGVAAPTLLMERAALELLSPGQGVIDQLTTLPEVVEVKGQVVLSGTTQPAAASLTLVATETYDVNPGVRASYVRTVDAGPDGNFSVKLLPGEYDVYAVPSTTTLGALTTTLAVSRGASPQAGKLIQLVDSAVLSGDVYNPAGSEPIRSPQVQAVPSTGSEPLALYDRALGPVSFIPRAATPVDDDGHRDGHFTVLADPGTFDFSVRPASDSRFAWLVRPNLVVGAASQDLGDLWLPLPVHYNGAVTTAATGNRPVPGALIRAYLYLDATLHYTSDPSHAASVLQIAETSTDDHGDFDLYLPSRIGLSSSGN